MKKYKLLLAMGICLGLSLAAGIWLVLSPAATSAAPDKPPADKPPADKPLADKPLSADSSLDDVLDALDVRGKTLQDFSADVQWKQTEAAVGSSTKWKGNLHYQNQPGKTGRVRVQFFEHVRGNIVESDNGKTMLEYLLEGDWLTTRDYKRTSQLRQQVSKPGQKINLLKLGEGPFPLPIGQDKKDVHDQFDVQKMPAAKDDPPGTVHLQLKPKAQSSLARKFTTIDVWVDLKLSMPAVIKTLDANQAQEDQTQLNNLQLNTGLKDKDFDLPAIDSKWSQRDEPFSQ